MRGVFIMTSHLLLTSLGIQAKDATYELDGRKYNSELAPLALYHLLPEKERFEKAVVLCTDKAKKTTFPILEAKLPIDCKVVDIPEGESKIDLQEIIHRILKEVPAKCKITLDLTHGFRSIPFLFFASSLYLSALKDVQIQKAWYGRLEKRNPDGGSPFVDLTILLEMVEWFFAVKSFKEMRNPQALADRLKDVSEKLDRNCPFKRNFNSLVSKAEGFSQLFGAGLPLELGKESHLLRQKTSELVANDLSSTAIPLAQDLLEEIALAAKPFEYPIDFDARTGWKSRVPLSMEEVHRQERLIDSYFRAGYYNNAIGLMRELIVSRVLMIHLPSDGDWLNFKRSRSPIEQRLGALMHFSQANESKDLLDDKRLLLAGFWSKIIDTRNDLHHHGMDQDDVRIERRVRNLKMTWDTLKTNLDDDRFWDTSFGGGAGRLLISPLGLFPGFLYTALQETESDVCLVLASKESKDNLDTIKRRSGYRGSIVEKIMDAHNGYPEIKDLLVNSRDVLLKADKIECNLTGGTTALQYAVIQLADIAIKLGKDVSWIALADERSKEEQEAEPYVLGKMVKIEAVKL
jgi:CRISPR-associated Csx2 family protein